MFVHQCLCNNNENIISTHQASGCQRSKKLTKFIFLLQLLSGSGLVTWDDLTSVENTVIINMEDEDEEDVSEAVYFCIMKYLMVLYKI